MTPTAPSTVTAPADLLNRFTGKSNTALPLYSLMVFALISMVMAIRSDGAWLDDDLCHYQIARAVWHLPDMVLNSWGRPGCTIPYVLVSSIGSAQAGFMAARLMTVAMSVTVIWLAWQTAERMRAPGAAWVPLMMLVMPEFFWESFTPCTEIPAALYSIAGVFCLSRGSRRWAAVCFAILPATRHELAPFLIPIGLYFLWRRDLVAALLLGWFETAWAIASWLTGQGQPILRYFTAQDATPYGSGNFYWYLVGWLKMAGIVLVGLCLAGTFAISAHECKRARCMRCLRPGKTGRRSRLRLLVVGGSLGLVVLETLLFAFNRFASGGYSTFLVPAAPLMAICASYALSNFPTKMKTGKVPAHRSGRGWARSVVLVVFAAIALLQLSIYLRPHRLTPHQKLIASTIASLKVAHPGCHIVGDSAWITYFDEISPGARERNAIDTWTEGHASPLYYIHDYSTGADEKLQKLMAVPNAMVDTAKLPGASSPIDLLILRRLSKNSTAQ